MDFVETEGDTIDAAIENALKLIGVPRDKVTVDIISEGRRGILGFGAQKAKVRAALRKSTLDQKITDGSDVPAPPVAQPTEEEFAAPVEPIDYSVTIEKALTALREILKHMDVAANVEQKSAANGAEIILEVKAADSGLLIGRKGQTLEALQYLIGRIAGERQGGDGPHIVIDIENYRERRRKSLEDMALRLGEKAKRQRKTVTVDALSAADRRIIHAALQDDPWVTTKSLGQGSYRRLLIIPEGDRKNQDEATPADQEQQMARPRRRGGRRNGAPRPEKKEG
ncbi:MAG TPA: RNA-binding cell elongation regulator Jag/EloR [Candidatus Limnocylindrales bacterium]|nr:RNA-binding cell elongation regulator Jag/EloR [Candidatus Limnocylindrales bacterium]